MIRSALPQKAALINISFFMTKVHKQGSLRSLSIWQRNKVYIIHSEHVPILPRLLSALQSLSDRMALPLLERDDVVCKVMINSFARTHIYCVSEIFILCGASLIS